MANKLVEQESPKKSENFDTFYTEVSEQIQIIVCPFVIILI